MIPHAATTHGQRAVRDKCEVVVLEATADCSGLAQIAGYVRPYWPRTRLGAGDVIVGMFQPAIARDNLSAYFFGVVVFMGWIPMYQAGARASRSVRTCCFESVAAGGMAYVTILPS
jgi:hypothetical protein